ncbi:SDR family oxidoreductase [Thalassomonas haliotis]|uniref:SDR family oxidoreductase n=1 Tax=Thalassomonas haliotis TaxID=485448 RepID=A0ABY7V9A9_9GAMM|nr:SDR family oxidoreductase [Thalassomonas haliotis]WDE10188.1 SDR family oxidoreductase [Thalassomonas haliotis]
MNIQPTDKVAIVTGASRGIGAAIAKSLASTGCRVVVNYASNEKAANKVITEIERQGGHAVAIKADISVPGEASALFDQAVTLFGAVDILINNAGIMQLSPVADTHDSSFDNQIAINLKGTFNTLRLAANRLREGGRIVNLSSSVVGLKPEGYGVYAATKAAVESLTAILSKELRGRNITVNAVSPGPTATELFLEGKPPHILEKLSRMSPLERLGEPTDIAKTVSFLVSNNGEWLNGQVLRANGGIV